ncbi:J domain-containing protein [Hymenobacter cellulosivorans]|uniref:J domain-containing protein n=1 Tax=Hymenobacter cellulosivorans TaxID=2932249 RepID=A0ABY4F6J2_9BACT|nr:J domain-containing protein [Hymenobacter cellulosivorans]UOQ52282.1 J domain-containing protein [Hymenobacter cellulosivorans]
MNLHNPATDLPAANSLPVRVPEAAPGTPAQQAFRQAIQDVENLRDRLRELEEGQSEARRRYWQQVGPLAQTVVAARRRLFAPLEEALLLPYFSRAEHRQLEELILNNARSLRDRFGEDVADILQRHAPTAKEPTPGAAESSGSNPQPETEAAPGHAKRKPKGKKAREAEKAALEEQQKLLGNTKNLYRQLARANHPDLERDPALAQEKTERMQRITRAYEANDLYTLLQLLSEHAPGSTDSESEDLLARYTQALRQQQDELKQRMNELKYGTTSAFAATGKKQEAELRQVKRHLRAEADYLQHIEQLMQAPEDLRDLLRQLSTEI